MRPAGPPQRGALFFVTRWTTPHRARRGNESLSLDVWDVWEDLKNDLIHDFRELTQVAALFHDVAVGQIAVHHAVAKAPGTGALRVEPNDILCL